LSDDSEDSDKQDNDININNQSSKDVIIQSKSIFTTSHNELSIIDQIESIDKNTSNRKTNFSETRDLSPVEKTSEDGNHEKAPSKNPEESTTDSVISLGSAGIESKDKSEGEGQSSSHQDSLRSVERGDISNQVSFTDSEEGKEIIVGGDFSGHISAACDHNADNNAGNRSKDGKDVCGISGASIVVTTSVEEVVERSRRPGTSSHKESSDEKLDREDTIDFSDETKSGVNRHGLCGRIIIITITGISGLSAILVLVVILVVV
jgi:hypothetical protein